MTLLHYFVVNCQFWLGELPKKRNKKQRQAGAELGQAQVKLEVLDKVLAKA